MLMKMIVANFFLLTSHRYLIDLRDPCPWNVSPNHIQMQDSSLPYRLSGYRDIRDVERFPQPLVGAHEYDVRMTYVTVVVTGTRCSMPCQDTAKTSLRSLTSGLLSTLQHCKRHLQPVHRLSVCTASSTLCFYKLHLPHITYFYRSCINTLQLQHHDEDFVAAYFVHHFTLGYDPFVFCRSQRPGSKFGVLSILLHSSE